jgi:hypothetical protein
MSGFTFRRAVREHTPMIIGLAGPTKSGKTMSALRLAVGLAKGGKIVMINTEGKRGHQYADKFQYLTADLEEPFSMERYEQAIKAASEINPVVLIVDSVSHSHEGKGGMLDFHETELDRLSRGDDGKRDKLTWAAWVKPKAAEASMVNAMLRMNCHIILCFRAKEKIKIVTGKPIIDLGWQPIASERIHFETIFTLTLTPHCKGIPDLTISDMREPFDKMVPPDKHLDEDLGGKLAQWAAGNGTEKKESHSTEIPPDEPTEEQALKDAKSAGMATTEQPPNEKPNETEIIAIVKKTVLSFQKRKEVMDYYNENRSTWKKDYSSTTFLELTKIVNDKLEQVK